MVTKKTSSNTSTAKVDAHVESGITKKDLEEVQESVDKLAESVKTLESKVASKSGGSEVKRAEFEEVAKIARALKARFFPAP